MILPRFYPIFDDINWLSRTLSLGVKLVQLRLKDKSPAILLGQLAAARELCQQYGATLVVNDHWEIALELGCDWLHLGQEDIDGADLVAVRAAGIKIGISTHNHAELERALELEPDYVALGPVYPTKFKKMKWQEQGVERVAEWKKLIGDIPLVAIGGISLERAEDVLKAGADTVSVITDITLHKDPDKRVKDWLGVV